MDFLNYDFLDFIMVVCLFCLMLFISYFAKFTFDSADSKIKVFFMTSFVYGFTTHLFIVLVGVILLFSGMDMSNSGHQYWWSQIFAYSFLFFIGMILTIIFHHKVLYKSFGTYRKECKEKKEYEKLFGKDKS